MRGRITTNTTSLRIGILVSLFMLGVFGRHFFQKYRSGMLGIGDGFHILLCLVIVVPVFVICVKGFLKNSRKEHIKKNKQNMLKIRAQIIGFKPWEKDKYYFIASDGSREFSSEEFVSSLSGIALDALETFKLMKINYNPNNPQETINGLNNYIQMLETSDPSVLGSQNTVANFLLTTDIPGLPKGANASFIIQKSLEELIARLQDGTPYIMVDKHKLSVGDSVDIYLDPLNEENYWIDTDFLYEPVN